VPGPDRRDAPSDRVCTANPRPGGYPAYLALSTPAPFSLHQNPTTVTGLCSAARGDAQTNPFCAYLSMLLRYRYTGTTSEEASGGWNCGVLLILWFALLTPGLLIPGWPVVEWSIEVCRYEESRCSYHRIGPSW